AVTTGPQSPPGWEVRYNATIALARRGSPHIKDEPVWEVLLEMLDEGQQLRNFRHKVKERGNIEVADDGNAYLTIITALQAIAELHKQKPDLDLPGLYPAIEKLTRSPNAAANTEAKRIQQLLAIKK